MLDWIVRRSQMDALEQRTSALDQIVDALEKRSGHLACELEAVSAAISNGIAALNEDYRTRFTRLDEQVAAQTDAIVRQADAAGLDKGQVDDLHNLVRRVEAQLRLHIAESTRTMENVVERMEQLRLQIR